ncbi:hypothetical protein EVAR_97457_1 [Eumeta japonica]|uniref:Uncharacterized protein n=1 Tax=Eumeta variegata TaxID=151549 RepID=A0A4C1WWX1_EUMVA|nr:hypothetical protein EVAR_97457_1 [Eumeta japonica]
MGLFGTNPESDFLELLEHSWGHIFFIIIDHMNLGLVQSLNVKSCFYENFEKRNVTETSRSLSPFERAQLVAKADARLRFGNVIHVSSGRFESRDRRAD